jgi:hypothetical protein
MLNYMLIIRYIVTLFSIQILAVPSGRSAKVTATARVPNEHYRNNTTFRL